VVTKKFRKVTFNTIIFIVLLSAINFFTVENFFSVKSICQVLITGVLVGVLNYKITK